MSAMIDRVAKAIGEVAFGYVDPVDTPSTWRVAVSAAESAMAAMRDPTPDMMQIAEGYADFVLPDAVGENTPAGRVQELTASWKKAIDVALYGGVGRNPNQ